MNGTLTRWLKINVFVSHHGGDDYRFRFEGPVNIADGMDEDDASYSGPATGLVSSRGDITVGGEEGDAVMLKFFANFESGLTSAEFLGHAPDSIVVGAQGDTHCPPVPGDQFNETGHVLGNRRRLKINDKKTEEGRFPYALWFKVVRTDGAVDIARYDPMIINRFD